MKPKIFLFAIGGIGYVLLELLYRGYSHITMFFAGGCCFLLINRICNYTLKNKPTPIKCIAGSAIITAIELMIGLIFNKNLNVWDYSNLPFNFKGQICLRFSIIWAILTIPIMLIAQVSEKRLIKK